MDKLLKGIMKYRSTVKNQMVKQFEQVRDNPKVCFPKYARHFYLQYYYRLSIMFLKSMRNTASYVKTNVLFTYKNALII